MSGLDPCAHRVVSRALCLACLVITEKQKSRGNILLVYFSHPLHSSGSGSWRPGHRTPPSSFCTMAKPSHGEPARECGGDREEEACPQLLSMELWILLCSAENEDEVDKKSRKVAMDGHCRPFSQGAGPALTIFPAPQGNGGPPCKQTLSGCEGVR